LRSIDEFIRTNCRLSNDDSPTILYGDNSAWVAQMQVGFVKGDQIKHIDLKYFIYSHDLIIKRALEIKKLRSTDNLADLEMRQLNI